MFVTDAEYHWLSSLIPFSQTLICLGIPSLAIALRCRMPRLHLLFYLSASAVLIYFALLVECHFLDSPVGEYENDHAPAGEQMGLGDGGVSLALLVAGFPLGLLCTAVVFALFYGGQLLVQRLRTNFKAGA